jgi:hypothetical protein
MGLSAPLMENLPFEQILREFPMIMGGNKHFMG